MHLSSVPRSLVQPEGIPAIEDKGHITIQAKIISTQIHAPFKRGECIQQYI